MSPYDSLAKVLFGAFHSQHQLHPVTKANAGIVLWIHLGVLWRKGIVSKIGCFDAPIRKQVEK